MELVAVKVRVPAAIREHLRKTAELAGVSVDVVAAVMLATVLQSPDLDEMLAEYTKELTDEDDLGEASGGRDVDVRRTGDGSGGVATQPVGGTAGHGVDFGTASLGVRTHGEVSCSSSDSGGCDGGGT